MIAEVPKNTSELFEKLKEKTEKLPQADRNAFTLDLMKFCIDWQFNYLAYQQEMKNNG